MFSLFIEFIYKNDYGRFEIIIEKIILIKISYGRYDESII